MNLRLVQFRGGPTTAGTDAPYFYRVRNWGADFDHFTARLRLSMYCSPCFPLRSTLTVLDRLGDFASRISRREYCHEQQTSRSRMNDGEIGYPQAMPHKRGA